jgi:predicted Fe-Mo cluster-binding NifX family protein
MKTAITATGATLDADVDPRFGRCAYFIVIDVNTMAFEAVENPNGALGQGAGIQSAQLLAGKGVKYVLTGHCGPNAYETLTAAGIGVILNCTGSVQDVIQRLKAGQLGTAAGPDVAGHTGMAGPPVGSQDQSAAFPPPRGRGMGMGGGGGRGMGRGMGRGRGGMGGGRGGGR